jgi:hypothetical protein
MHTPSQLRSLHLLRALLREVSYLPDEQARSYFRRHVVARFRAYQPKQNATSRATPHRRTGFRRRDTAIVDARTRPMQRKAVKGLNYLRRANAGEKACLTKVLFFTYGRMGRRRYALLEDLLKPDAQETEPVVSPLQALYYSNKRFLQFFDAPKKASDTDATIAISNRFSRLKAVVTSQAARGVSLGPPLKQTVLKTPLHNVWERPMPIKRARNNVKRWYAHTIAKLLPPLPSDEWDRLRALATGELRWSGRVARRTPAKTLSTPAEEDTSSLAILQGLALDKPSKAERPGGSSRPNDITARSMRRLYRAVLTYCCKLEWNDTRRHWAARWANMNQQLPKVFQKSVPNTMFAGVNDHGRLEKAKTTKTQEQSSAEIGARPRRGRSVAS